jgi:hypothetical protein
MSEFNKSEEFIYSDFLKIEDLEKIKNVHFNMLGKKDEYPANQIIDFIKKSLECAKEICEKDHLFERYINPPEAVPYISLVGRINDIPYRIVFGSEFFGNPDVFCYLCVFYKQK